MTTKSIGSKKLEAWRNDAIKQQQKIDTAHAIMDVMYSSSNPPFHDAVARVEGLFLLTALNFALHELKHQRRISEIKSFTYLSYLSLAEFKVLANDKLLTQDTRDALISCLNALTVSRGDNPRTLEEVFGVASDCARAILRQI